jgi:hypothetical protein
MGGKFHLKLNTGTRPIANKYREGKMKSTLKRESKAREAVKMETIEVSSAYSVINLVPHRVWERQVHLPGGRVSISLVGGESCLGR